MKKIQCGLLKLILAALQLCAASLALVGLAYSVMNMMLLFASAPSSAALAVGGSAATMCYIAFCFICAAKVSAGESMAQFFGTESTEKPFR